MLLRQALSILILPFTVAVVVPALLLPRDGADASLAARVSGGLLLILGVSLVVRTIWHFATIGRGTLAPWDPPRRLVVAGIYRHVRNPMITGVFLILVGESLVFASKAVGAWAMLFFAANAVYIPMVEEKSLARRFGAAYGAYVRHVPRWIPRRSPWRTPVDGDSP